MSDSDYGLGGSGDDWTSSYSSPTANPTKQQAVGASQTAASASPASTDSYTPSYSAPASSSPAPSPSTTSYMEQVQPNKSALPTDNIETTAPNPIAADQQARSIANSLQAAGHQVSWSGNQLMVDGRPYDVTATGAAAGGAPSSSGVDTSGMDPRLVALYQKYGATPTGPGTGITDISYWNGKDLNDPYYLGRLEQDLQGTGMDQGGGGGGGGGIDTGLIPSYAQVSSVGNPSALSPQIDMPAAPWGAEGIPTYQGGNIGFDDIPNFTAEGLQQQMNGGENASSLASLVKNITDHPTSLDDHTVDTMKAQMKDTLAEQGQLEDSVTKGQAGMLGIGDSPWLAAERAAARRSTGQAIASGGQNIDIEAGKTRQGQKLASAGVGQSFQNEKDQQVLQTVNAGLQRATVTGNRMALRESVAQAAAASKQNAMSIMANFISQQTGQKISAAALAQQGQEFAESLMMQIAGANVGVQEFGANYGLQAANMQHQFNNDDWSHSYMDTNNLSPTA